MTTPSISITNHGFDRLRQRSGFKDFKAARNFLTSVIKLGTCVTTKDKYEDSGKFNYKYNGCEYVFRKDTTRPNRWVFITMVVK